MKKKLLTVLMSVFAISTCLFALTACEDPHEHSYATQVENPTCTEQGYTTYTCECGDSYVSDYVNALGHNYTKVYTWNGNSCTATATCVNDSTDVITETVTGVYAKDADANCTTAETGHYVATFTNTMFAAQTSASVNVGEKLNHSFTNYVYNDDAMTGDLGTATAICDRDGCYETHTVSDYIVSANFKVNGNQHNLNNNIMLGDVVSIEVLLNGQLITNNVSYQVVRRDSVESNDYVYTVANGTFKASLTGVYNVTVYYTENGINYISTTIELNVIANTNENARILNTFSDSTSVVAAYSAEDKQTMVEGTTWYSEYNGKYGVISTVGQEYNTDYSAFYLRSADYDTQKQMESAGFAQTVFGMDEVPSEEGYLVGFNCENWDYLSIKVYFAKPQGVTGNTLNVYYADNSAKGDIITVNYNKWVELKLDKAIVLKLLCNAGRLLQQYATANDAAHRKPMFYADSANVGTVYFDSMSFEKYAEYKHFAEFYYDDNGTQVPKDEIYKIDVNRVDVPLQIKIKLEENDSDYLTIPLVKSGASIDGTSANIVVDYYEGYSSNIKRELQGADNKKINYYAQHMLYYDRSAFNVPCQLIVSNNNKNGAGTVHLKYIYTHTDGTKYVGYLATKIMFVATPQQPTE